MPWRDGSRLDSGSPADFGSGGGFRRWLRRVFGEGENPLTWAIPVYSAWGIRVRVHVLFVFIAIVEMIWSVVAPDGVGVVYAALGLTVLAALVLAHEYGHCAAARMVGGEAEEIVLWPLGGLAWCSPPDRWDAHLWTTLGGPAVNLALAPILGGALWAATGDAGMLTFNPFDVPGYLGAIQTGSTLATYGVVTLAWAYVLNWVLLAFNMAVPMLPMDAGRALHALLWRGSGELRATRVAGVVGVVAAVLLLVVGVVGEQTLLMGIALFGGLVSWQSAHGARFVEETGFDVPALRDEPDPAEEKRRRRASEQQAEIDRILAKISATGLASLTKAERRALDRASASQRGADAGRRGPADPGARRARPR